jgi:cytochrome bd-type quinol oxidase subunit 2
MALDTERLSFLYRTDQGVIDRDTWRRGAAALVAIAAPLTLIWAALQPYTVHDLAKSRLFDPLILFAYTYLMVYAAVVLLLAISFVNLSAKRFRDKGATSPLALASLLPLAAFFAGAAHVWPSLSGPVPGWFVYPFDALALAVAGWTAFELGFKD